jgi:predicted transcriptional regulator
MLNSDRFLDAYSAIEHYLRKMAQQEKWTSCYYKLVDIVSRSTPTVRRLKENLKEFADLRNAIVHERSYGHVIAEPNDQAVAEIERIATLILKLPRVIPLFQAEVIALTVKDSIARAVQIMYEQFFSTIPIYDGATFLGLLTTNTIARWLGSRATADPVNLAEVSVAHVLEYTEHKDRCCFLSRDATVFDILERFQIYEKQGKRLEAILITHTGKPSEVPLGIITVCDLPKALKEIELRGG